MRWTGLIAAVAVCLLVAPASRADDALPFLDEQSFTPMRLPHGLSPADGAASVEVTDEYPEYPLYQPDRETPLTVEPYPEPPYADLPYSEPVPGCCEVCGCGDACQCGDINYRSGWTLSVEASALQSDMASRDVDAWPDDFGAAGRVALGYEWSSGFGIRAQAWGYSVNGPAYIHYFVSSYWYGTNNFIIYDYDDYSPYWYYPVSATYSREIELSMASTYLDFYKAITLRAGELLIGSGPAFGHLEFNSPPYGDGSKYFGGGVTVFGQGTYPFVRRRRWEMAFTGQARVTLLTGAWHIDHPYGLVDTSMQHSDSMSIVELGIGPEIRRQFGRSANHYWFVRTLAEFQQWRSDRMGPMAGDTLALQGATVNLGVNW